MSIQVVFQQMLVIFLLIAIGYFIYKKGFVGEDASRTFSWLVVNVTNPAVIISSVLDADPISDLGVLAWDMLITLLIYAASILLGVLIPWLLRAPKKERGFYHAMTVYPNSGFMGIPVISAVLGNQAMIFVVIYNILFNLFFYSHGMYVLTPSEGGKRHLHIDWKQIMNIGTVFSLIALAICIFRIKLPAVLSETVSYTGRATTLLAMLVLGMALARIPFREIFSDLRLLVYSLIRLLVIPLAAGLILRQVTDQTLFVQCMVMLLAMPGANLPLMYCQQENIRADVLAKGITLTTLLSLVTITLVSVVIA